MSAADLSQRNENRAMREAGLIESLRADIAIIARQSGRSGGWPFAARYLLFSPGFHLVLGIRVQRALGKLPFVGGFLRRVAHYFHTMRFASDISLAARIGPGLYTPHPFAIMVGDGAVLGANVSLFQGVTIGQRSALDPRKPVVEDDVYIGAGAVILGAVRIGHGATIGANAVVLCDVPAGARAVGNPARILG